jgi:L-ribulokinase
MCGVKQAVYAPHAEHAAVYARLYRIYRTLHDAFGTRDFHGSLAGVMKELIALRQEARNAA